MPAEPNAPHLAIPRTLPRALALSPGDCRRQASEKFTQYLDADVAGVVIVGRIGLAFPERGADPGLVGDLLAAIDPLGARHRDPALHHLARSQVAEEALDLLSVDRAGADVTGCI